MSVDNYRRWVSTRPPVWIQTGLQNPAFMITNWDSTAKLSYRYNDKLPIDNVRNYWLSNVRGVEGCRAVWRWVTAIRDWCGFDARCQGWLNIYICLSFSTMCNILVFSFAYNRKGFPVFFLHLIWEENKYLEIKQKYTFFFCYGFCGTTSSSGMVWFCCFQNIFILPILLSCTLPRRFSVSSSFVARIAAYLSCSCTILCCWPYSWCAYRRQIQHIVWYTFIYPFLSLWFPTQSGPSWLQKPTWLSSFLSFSLLSLLSPVLYS